MQNTALRFWVMFSLAFWSGLWFRLRSGFVLWGGPMFGFVPGFLRFWDIGGVSYMRQLSLAGQHRPRKWRSWPFPAILFRANRSAFSAASALLHRGACSTRMESCADVVDGEFS